LVQDWSLLRRCGAIAASIAAAALAATGAAAAAPPATRVLERFGGADGAMPQGGLVIDAAGALYGTTSGGGHCGSGTVFELTRPPAGATRWTRVRLHDFCLIPGLAGGTVPVAGLTADGAGGFFGSASAGGADGFGIVFRLRPAPAGSSRWGFTVLHQFCAERNCRDGGAPTAVLLRSPGDRLYGTTFVGGADNYGAVFSLTPPAAGQTLWRYRVIHDFAFHDGTGPSGDLAFGHGGKLYGTTSAAGAHGHGSAHELTPPGGGGFDWSFRIVYRFCAQPFCADGSSPNSGLLFGRDGILYGATLGGGSGGWGTVYALDPASRRTLRVLHDFAFSDGAAPVGGLIQDRNGALYGTTSMAGAFGHGTVFKLAPSTGGRWFETVLHHFTGVDGDQPSATLAMDKAGVVYGTTEAGGGANNDGVVFAVTP
jgi:uncharacterized repeat protein (TIGR03803 family)